MWIESAILRGFKDLLVFAMEYAEEIENQQKSFDLGLAYEKQKVFIMQLIKFMKPVIS